MKPILLFDGDCNLCNKAVQFVVRHDKKEIFLFASLQSDFGQEVLDRFGFPKDSFDSFLYLEDGVLYDRSTAALLVAKKLTRPWSLLYSFIFIPKPLRDLVYSYVSKNRYKWFGKQESCLLLTPELRKRFLD